VDLYEEIIGFPESVLLHGRYHDILKNKVILSGSKVLFEGSRTQEVGT